MPDAAQFSDELVDRIASAVVAKLRQVTVAPSPVLTRAEAKQLAGRNSEAAFCGWCRRWGVQPVSRGRYARRSVEHALAREVGLKRARAA